jgi:RNA polymerase sigma-70 factor (ECF subfamily)
MPTVTPSVTPGPTDESLYLAYRDRNEATALRDLLERHWASTYRLAHAIVRDPGAAEDVAQETFVRVVAAARARKTLDPFTGWLRTVTVNEARMSLRSSRRREQHEEKAAARRPAEANDPGATIRAYTDGLEERVRLPLYLHFALGLTHKEVADVLGCPAGTASSRIRAGLEQVREGLVARGNDVALASVEASLVAWSGEVLARPVPVVPSPDAIVARAATKAVFVLPGKKIAFFALAAAIVGIGVAELVLPSFVGEPRTAPGSQGSGAQVAVRTAAETREPPATAAPTTTTAALAPEVGPSAIEVPVPPGDPPGLHLFRRGPDAGPKPVVNAAAPPPATAKRAVQVHGRVIGADGRAVEGARVVLDAAIPRSGGYRSTLARKMNMRARKALPDMGAVDREVQHARTTSTVLRQLTELARTESGIDGQFTLSAPGVPEDAKLFVRARLDRDSASAAGEKSLGVAASDDPVDAGDVTIVPLPSVSVVVACGGAAVESASVFFQDAGLEEATIGTDATGLARYATGAGSVVVTVTKPGFAAECMKVVLESDQRLQVDLVPSAPVSGTVSGPQGEPLAGVPVQAEDADAPANFLATARPLSAAVTDASGRYTLEGLAPGRSYTVVATPADASYLTGTVDVTPPSNDTSFTLARAGALVVSISLENAPATPDPRLTDWPGVEAEYLDATGKWVHSPGDRTVNGPVITFGRLQPGSYRVNAHALLFPAAVSATVAVTSGGEPAQTSLALTLGREVKGRVVGAQGAPLPQARVTRAASGLMMSLMVDETGTFDLRGMSMDPTEIVLGAPGYLDRKVTIVPGQTDLGDVMLTPAPAAPVEAPK